MTTGVEIPERFWSRVVKDASPGCWIWTGAKASGYGRVYWFGKVRPAHHVTYERYVGQVPPGLDLDHLCRNRACVNPEHLEAVTRQVNLMRGRTIVAAKAARTHCPNDHEFTPENTYTWRNARYCKTCRAGIQRSRDYSRYRVGPVRATCVICGVAFEYVQKSGPTRNTCSDACTTARKRKAARDSARRKREAV